PFSAQALSPSAASKLLHTSAALHSSRATVPARSQPFDLSEPALCQASKAGSLRAIASDNLLSGLKAPRPSRAGCCISLRYNIAAFGPSSDPQDSNTRPNIDR